MIRTQTTSSRARAHTLRLLAATSLALLPACKEEAKEAPAPSASVRPEAAPSASAHAAALASTPKGAGSASTATSNAAGAIAAPTPKDFYAHGVPTLIFGTGGDDPVNAAIRAQVENVKRFYMPTSPVVPDTSVNLAEGVNGWPKNPVVWGGTHINRLLKELGTSLPFQMERGKLTLGGQVFEGDDVALVAVIPAGPKNPQFLLLASTGMPGVAQLRTISSNDQAIFVGDVFGKLTTGHFATSPSGAVTAELSPRASRLAWRSLERDAAPIPGGKKAHVTVRFIAALKPNPSDEEAVAAACARGVSNSVKALALPDPSPLTVYVYPDKDSKKEIMGDPGNGLAVIFARAANVIHADPAPGGVLEKLITHEATHVQAYYAWGPPGTTFFSEGLAAWATNGFGDSTLDQWKKLGLKKLALRDLLPDKGFYAQQERDTYPRAGLTVRALVKRVGLPMFAKEIFPAGPAELDAACKRAGTTAAAIEADVP